MKRPIINIWILLPLGIILFFSLYLTTWCFRDVFLTPPEIAEKHPDRFEYFYMYNLFLFVMTFLSSVMSIITIPMILMRKKARWIWYMVMSILVLTAFAMFNTGLRTAIIFLVTACIAFFWYSQQNRLWYGVLYARKK